MRFRTYQGARQGIGDVINALAAPGGNAYGDHMRDLAYVDGAQATARNADSETALNDQKRAARDSILGALEGVPLPQGLTPGVVSSMFVGSENPNFRDFTQGMVDMGGTAAQGMAMDAARRGDTNQANQFNVLAKPGETYQPYGMNESGVVNQATGAYTPSDLSRAKVGQANAAAGASNALARQRGFLEVSPGATLVQTPNAVGDAIDQVYQAPYSPSQQSDGGVGGGKPSSNALKQRELEAQGVPTQIARGLAYGAIKQVSDGMGNVVLIDYASGQVMGQMKIDARTKAATWIPSQPTASTAALDGAADPLSQARDAISRGAPRDAVIARLRQMGLDPSSL